MKIKELHSDIERYLANDCYCPNEIYDTSGFYYRLFKADDVCKKLIENENLIACLSDNQALVFWKNYERIDGATRYDATENNIKGILNYVKTGEKFDEDRFDKEGYAKSLNEILSMSSFIIRD